MTSHKDRCLCSSNERCKHNIFGHAAAPYVLADTGVTYVDLERPRFVMCAAEYVKLAPCGRRVQSKGNSA